ncbi:Zn-dependent protease (includes SpoIVFB) [Halobaculum gomorrense]|uniref:Zn-dependent protease (Includes SpoIVFB) n=1 Tax=Halobaculum gomorrense TaxID=43928 RepID=A0A1M5ULW5_9EURY|nr:Zn-dependent protease (includes SpoIVFB) [Halobaculum gomorrense]
MSRAGAGGGRATGSDAVASVAGLSFSGRELRDLLVAWVALSVAFAVFFAGGGSVVVNSLAAGAVGSLGGLFAVSLVTAGVAFLLHELGHKVTAVRFGQRAAFRADYGMLFLAVVAALGGFLFAAPGAVHHVGRITKRQNGLIALAGPVVNLVLAAVFVPLLAIGMAGFSALALTLGTYGVAVNLLLAAFNLIPFGPLDGATVRSWSTPVWLAAFLPSAALAVGFALFVLF